MGFLCWNQPLLGLFHAESGAGVWRRAVDDSLRSAEVSRCRLDVVSLLLCLQARVRFMSLNLSSSAVFCPSFAGSLSL